MPPPPPTQKRAPAFTLIELLVATGFGLILFAALMAMATRLLRAGVRDDNQQSAQDTWVRVHQFLTIEVGEAGRTYQGTTPTEPIATNQAPSECAGASRDASSESFQVRVPTSITTFRTITYYVSGSNLWRCGPPVLGNGRLDLSAASSRGLLSYNTVLRNVSATLNSLNNNRTVAYTLDIRNAQNGVEFSGNGRAWAQSSFIQAEQ